MSIGRPRDNLSLTIFDIIWISLGLPIDISVAEDFQSTTKHLNYLYGKAIDGIYEFFKLDSNINNSISKPVFSILNKNSIFKKYSNILSDKGFNL